MAKKEEKKEEHKRQYGSSIITPVVRTSFTYLTKMDKTEFNGKVTETYRATAVVPEVNKKVLDQNKKALLAFAREVWGDNLKWGDFATPYKVGNQMKPEKLEKYPAFKDTVYFEMRSNKPVGIVVGKDRIPYKDLSEEKKKEIAIDNAGYHAIFAFVPASYVQTQKVREKDAKGNVREITEDVKGINFYLESVWYVKNDERFGSGGERDGSEAFAGISVEADFDDITSATDALDSFDDSSTESSSADDDGFEDVDDIV